MLRSVATWGEFEQAAPELAAAARELLEARPYLTIATLRRDGSPRISGIECSVAQGELWFGSMEGAVKARDLHRDPRFALHSGTDPTAAEFIGDAKVSGVAIAVPSEGESHRFRADISEVSTVRHGGEPADHLVIESWRPGEEARRVLRY
jgi:Pyridoxamine 5'-phosphate oxidase